MKAQERVQTTNVR